MDQVVADLRPFLRDREITDVMAHAGGARRENREVGAALLLELELSALDALANLVIGHFQARARRQRRLILNRFGLVLAEAMQVLGLGRVVAVAIDDHDAFTSWLRVSIRGAVAPGTRSDSISCVNEIELFFDAVETAIDLVKTPVHAVETPGLARDLNLEMADLRHDMPHRGLKPEYARLEVRNIGLQLVDLGHKLVESTPHMPQMLKNDIVGRRSP